MSEHPVLGRASIDLLLALLEAEEAVITGTAVELMHHAASPLIEAHLLVAAGYDDVVGIQDGDDEEMIALFPIRENGALGHADRHTGFAAVPRERLLRRRVDIDEMLRLMMREMDLPEGWTAHPLIDGMVWEIAGARLAPKASRRTLWFARRLTGAVAMAGVAEKFAQRPVPSPLLVLTSTSADRIVTGLPDGAVLVSVRDVLRSPDDLTVHAEIAEGRLRGHLTLHDPALPVWLSPDGRTLRFRCGAELQFRGPKQIAVLKKLKAAFDRGRAVRVKDFTAHGGIAKVFGTARWKELAPFLEQREDGWTFKR